MPEGAAPGMTWASYIARLIEEHGSLAAVALRLVLNEGVDADAASVERGLRRLRSREHQDGGQYGLRLLRAFGLPREVEDRVRWMGVYHSRFTDLPVSLCLDQLRLWDRPPVAESRARVWLELGFATCAMRQEDLDTAESRLARARASSASPAAQIEQRLAEAYVASRRGAPHRVRALLDECESLLRAPDLEPPERAALEARWLEQRAYQHLHPPGEQPPDYEAAEALLRRMGSGASLFVDSKRESGLAYVHFRRGNREKARAHAELAVRHAGDGGFVRLRVAYLGLLARIVSAPEDACIRARAARAARSLEDEDLLQRVAPERADG